MRRHIIRMKWAGLEAIRAAQAEKRPDKKEQKMQKIACGQFSACLILYKAKADGYVRQFLRYSVGSIWVRS